VPAYALLRLDLQCPALAGFVVTTGDCQDVYIAKNALDFWPEIGDFFWILDNIDQIIPVSGCYHKPYNLFGKGKVLKIFKSVKFLESIWSMNHTSHAQGSIRLVPITWSIFRSIDHIVVQQLPLQDSWESLY